MSHSSRRRARSGSRRHPFHDAYEIKIRPERNLPAQVVLLIWRWRTELLLIAALWTIYHQLTPAMSPAATVAVMAGPVLVALAVPWSRRLLLRRLWCVASRHCVRACLIQLRTTNHDGRLPWVLWIRPTPVGERAWLLMLPGLAACDLENHTEALAAACWARETRIQRIRALACLVRLDIIRRDPLTKCTPINNPLLQTTHRTPESTPAPVVTSAVTPTRAATTGRTTGRTTGTAKPTPTTTANHTGVPKQEAPVLVNGEDVSDYV